MKAGIYIHIPFCRKACHYCDFHFSTQLKYKSDMLACLIAEVKHRASSFQKKYRIASIYFGGGTPSVLEAPELDRIMSNINKAFDVDENVEITLEANPDDLDKQKLKALRKSGINRLSIGVQSFDNAHLKWMNRSHNARQAEESIENAKEVGFQAINVDLIFAIPGMTITHWSSQIKQLISHDVEHWSCYNLTVEPKTVLHHQVKKGKVKPTPDQEAADQYQLLMGMALDNGMEHYEISNFCRPGKYSLHNANYWRGVPYMGIGPSAHSFDGTKRYWNIRNNALYMKAITNGDSYTSEEILTPSIQYNEYVMTGLRTKWGCSISQIEALGAVYAELFNSEIQPFISKGWVELKETTYTLTHEGKLMADHIASELFWVD